MQDHRQHILRPVLGPFKIISSIFWDQCWAHASPAAASLVPVLGPYKSISSTYFQWCWAHSRHSIISCGPTLIFHNACLLCQWAHPKALVVGYDGPILKICSHCLHGPMWAFPIYSVLLQMGFDENIMTFLCHYVFHPHPRPEQEHETRMQMQTWEGEQAGQQQVSPTPSFFSLSHHNHFDHDHDHHL